MEEEIESVKIRNIGVLSLAGTFAIISFIIGVLFACILIPFWPLVLSTGILPFQLPSSSLFLILPVGFALSTFILFLLLGLFYNLAALITKGIKLYS